MTKDNKFTEPVKGFRDFTGQEAEKREAIRNIIRNSFENYGFEPAETPVVEYESFVKGDEEQSGDEAISDVFTLKDKGDRNLALRYEFTFQLDRLAKNKKLPYKRYQIGPVFRDEPVSANRFRQFTQCDIDIIGSTVKDEAEVLKVTSDILSKLRINFIININNRKLLNEILEEQGVEEKTKAIREIDKMDKLSEEEVREKLRVYGAENVLEIFKESEEFFKKYESYKEISELKEMCSLYGIEVNFTPYLARGLSYYNGSVFEVTSDIKETITAGGSFYATGVQSTGLSLGLDRLQSLTDLKKRRKSVLVASIGQDEETIKVAEKLRKEDIPTTVSFSKIKKSLEYADSKEISFVIFMGDEEVNKQTVKFKNMDSGEEKELNLEDFISTVKND